MWLWLGFGEVASTLCAAGLFAGRNGAPPLEFGVALPAGRAPSPSTQARLAAAGVRAAVTPLEVAEAVAGAEVVLSAVTPAQALPVAEVVIPYLTPGTIYVDLNSTDAATAQVVAAAVVTTGALPVDGAIMGAVPLHQLDVPIALAGPGAQAFHARAQALGLNTWVLSERAGQASALKMLWSVISKGAIALVAEALIAAHRLELLDPIRQLLAQELGKTGSDAMVLRMLRSTARSGARRLDEMAAAARTVEGAGVPAWTIAATQQWIAALAAIPAAAEADSTEAAVSLLAAGLQAASQQGSHAKSA